MSVATCATSVRERFVIIRQFEQLITFIVSRMKVFIALCLCFILVELAMSKTKEQGIKDRTGQVVATVEAFQKLGCRFTCVS